MQDFPNLGKRKIDLKELETFYQFASYQELVTQIQQLIAAGTLSPVRASRTNGKRPPLAQRYWVHAEKKEQDVTLIQELTFQLHPALQNVYYLQHLKQYAEDRNAVLAVNRFWKEQRALLDMAVSMNERSFQIWQAEKFLKEGDGQRIIKNLGLSVQDLNIYQTTEPLAYYVHHKNTPQNIIIIENKDTFYSMRRHLLSGKQTILGLPAGTLIYGGGKKIQRTITDFEICVEPYLTATDNCFYYFGDLDYEGIGIFQTLQRNMAEKLTLYPFQAAYCAMLHKAEGIQLPPTKDGQIEIAIESFMTNFSANEQEQMQQILKSRNYVPQEILTIADF